MKLEEHSIASESGEYLRKAWYLPSLSEPRKAAVFLDGEFYVDHMDAPLMVRDLERKGLIPPIACLFISHANAEARHRDYVCNASFAKFAAEDAVSWIRRRDASVPACGNLIGGTSLGGLEAAFIAVRYPKTFAFSLCQSASFWWNEEWLKSNVGAPLGGSRFWLSVGDRETESGVAHPPSGMLQETDQISASERFAGTLGEYGVSTHFHLYAGGHEFRPWKEEFPDAMKWLLA
jgi:enterochelin esterase family protein